MKKTILIIALIFCVLFAGAIVAAPLLFKDRLKALVKEEINNRLDAKVDFEDVSVSIIHSFPDLSVSLDNLSITGKGKFKDEVLADIGKLYVSFDIMSVIKGAVSEVNSIELSRPVIKAKVLKSGEANWDIYKSAEEVGKGEIKAESQVNFTISKYSIIDGTISYNDLEGDLNVLVRGFNHHGSGDFQSDQFILRTTTDASSLDLASGNISYLSGSKLDMKTDIDMDLSADKYVLEDNYIKLNELEIAFNGAIDNDKKAIDLTFSSDQNDFRHILSMIPAVYRKDFSSIKTKGNMDLKGNIKGSYAGDGFPGFALDLDVKDGMFKYPDLPTAVNNINFKSSITNPGGTLDKTVIDINKGHLELDKAPIDLTLQVKNPVSDPLIKTKINGKVDLSRIPDLYPMEDVKAISGSMLVDVVFEGRMSDVERSRYSKVNADGEIRLDKIRYESENLTMPVYVEKANLNFNPRNVTVQESFAKIGNSDFDVTGTLDNLIGYLLTDEKLTGTLTLKSKQFDANEWMSDKASASTSGSDEGTPFFLVPDGLDLSATGKIDKILYDDIEITNVTSRIKMTDETLHLSNFTGNLMGGLAKMNGSYSTKDVAQPKVRFSYEIEGFDAAQTYQFFKVAQGFAPIMKYIDGKFDSDLTIDGVLTDDLDLELNTVTGNGLVSISNANIKGFPALEKIAEVLKIKELSNLNIQNAWTVFELKDGRIAIDPFDVKKGNINMNVSGSNGLDYSLAYKLVLDVPSSELGNGYSLVTDWISKNPIPGLDKAVPDIVQFHLNVGGTVDKPTVKLGKIKGKQDQTLKEQITADIKEELEIKKEEAKEEVKEQVEAVKEEVEKEVDKAKEEAEEKVQEEIDKTKEKAKDKLKDIFGIPRK